MSVWLRQVNKVSAFASDTLSCDILESFLTSNSTLSFYGFPSKVSFEENLNRAAVAFVSIKGKLGDFEYISFDASEKELSDFGVNLIRTPGETPDALINGFHMDFQFQSPSHMAAVVAHIAKIVDPGTINAGKIKPLLVAAVASGQLALDKLKLDNSVSLYREFLIEQRKNIHRGTLGD